MEPAAARRLVSQGSMARWTISRGESSAAAVQPSQALLEAAVPVRNRFFEADWIRARKAASWLVLLGDCWEQPLDQNNGPFRSCRVEGGLGR